MNWHAFPTVAARALAPVNPADLGQLMRWKIRAPGTSKYTNLALPGRDGWSLKRCNYVTQTHINRIHHPLMFLHWKWIHVNDSSQALNFISPSSLLQVCLAMQEKKHDKGRNNNTLEIKGKKVHSFPVAAGKITSLVLPHYTTSWREGSWWFTAVWFAC